MNLITSKLWIARLCLIFFSSLFTSEKAFSYVYWDKKYTKVTYNVNENSICIGFLLYHDLFKHDERGFLDWCEFSYSEDGKKYYYLMRAATKDQKGTQRTWIKLSYKKPSEKIQLLNSIIPEKGSIWPEGKDLDVELKVANIYPLFGIEQQKSIGAFVLLKWHLPRYNMRVNFVKFCGLWIVNDESGGDIIDEVYKPLNIYLNTVKKPYSEFSSDSISNVNVSGRADVISVKGADPGVNIKVYSAAGVVLKSVVAKDDVINIKLPENQMYIVKAGEACHKVAL